MAYSPKQGDIILLNFNPTLGHEQRGRRPALVVSNATFHNFEKCIVMVCPITNTSRDVPTYIRLNYRTKTTGYVLTDQVKALDFTKRNPVFVEKIPKAILSRVCEIISTFTQIED